MLRSFISGFTTDPLGSILTICYTLPAILLAIVLHEWAHGYVAYRSGDPTAKMLGRLSLNPLKHIDPYGALLMLVVGFGWAKPVPINPRNFNNPKRDHLMVALAGIVMNLTLFILSTFIIVVLNAFIFDLKLLEMMGIKASWLVRSDYSYFWGIYMGNFAAFEASARIPFLMYVQRFFVIFSVMNLGLALFNFLPVPPLDGYHILNDVVFKGRLYLTPQMSQMLYFGMIALLLFTDVITGLLGVCRNFLQTNTAQFFSLFFGG